MRTFSFFVLLITLISLIACSNEPKIELPVEPETKDLIKASDISFLPEIREEGTIFYNAQNSPKDVLDILKDAGCNTLRLRVWHKPANVRSTLGEVATFAAEARGKGFKIWITLHYSDSWADPGKQTKPQAWQSANLQGLADSVYNYTKKVMQRLNPEYIQIGNEINGGMLWPEGAIANRSNFITFLKRGADAVRDVSSTTKIMIHYAGTDADWFYDILDDEDVDYDIIGLSYYPRWHSKNLVEVESTLKRLSETNNKDILFAETAYPFTLQWNDWTNNLIGEQSHLLSGYAASPEGQKAFMQRIKSMVLNTERAIGFAYWAPEWVAFRGNEATNGSDWENMALFNFQNKALPAIEVFKD
jgi:arabinogalactan endo-1,4-beta-galactosidase